MLPFKRALILFVFLSILCGIAYPLLVTISAQALFPHRANGSLLVSDGRVVGSEWIGQTFTGRGYFHGRPSATEPAYDASGSAGSNLGPSNTVLMERVKARVDEVRRENGMATGASVPADLVLASASGLDPHISPEAATLQVPRVARERSLSNSAVESLVSRFTERPLLGIWGRERVNVLKLNMALDQWKR